MEQEKSGRKQKECKKIKANKASLLKKLEEVLQKFRSFIEKRRQRWNYAQQ